MFGYSSSNSSTASLYRWARSSLPHQSRRNVICSSGSTVPPLPGSPPALLPEQAVSANAAALAAPRNGRRRRGARLAVVVVVDVICTASPQVPSAQHARRRTWADPVVVERFISESFHLCQADLVGANPHIACARSSGEGHVDPGTGARSHMTLNRG